MSAFIPGPWTSTEQDGPGPGYLDMACVEGPDGKTIAYIEPTHPEIHATATARLMSAAPDMFAALKVARKDLLDWTDIYVANPYTMEVIAEIDAALAKAEQQVSK